MKPIAIVLGMVAWLIPASAQIWMWQRSSSSEPSQGLLWMIVTFWSLLPAGALSMCGAWLWHRAGRAAAAPHSGPLTQRIGLALIAMPAVVVGLLGAYVVANTLI